MPSLCKDTSTTVPCESNADNESVRGYPQRRKTPLGIFLGPTRPLKQQLAISTSRLAQKSRNCLPAKLPKQSTYASMLEKWTVPNVVSLKRRSKVPGLVSHRRITPIKVEESPLRSVRGKVATTSPQPSQSAKMALARSATPSTRSKRGAEVNQLPKEYHAYAASLRLGRPSQTHSTKLVGAQGQDQSPHLYVCSLGMRADPPERDGTVGVPTEATHSAGPHQGEGAH